MKSVYQLIFAVPLCASLALFSGCAGDEQPPTCGTLKDLPVYIYVDCDQASYAPAEELGELALVVEGRVDDGPWTECVPRFSGEAQSPLHLCDETTIDAPGIVVFTCEDRLVTEVRAIQGTRDAQASTFYEKLSCIYSHDVVLSLTESAR